jgi:hypothetical protein
LFACGVDGRFWETGVAIDVLGIRRRYCGDRPGALDEGGL